MATRYLHPVTPEKAANLKALLKTHGAAGARVKQLRNGACRVNLKSRDDRPAALDAFIEANACNCTGHPFTDTIETRHSWNGATEIFLHFLF